MSTVDTVGPPITPGLLMCASRDTDAKMTWISTGPAPLAVKVPVTPAAGDAVRAEGEALRALADLPISESLRRTLPRVVGTPTWDGLPVLVTTALPGVSLATSYHRWGHTARRRRVHADLRLAGDWLGRLQAETSRSLVAEPWGDRVVRAVARRWDGSTEADRALERLGSAAAQVDACAPAATAVHGDFWFGNVLVARGAVSGVVDWESGAPTGSPLRDLARFAVSYALYLDRHTRLGGRVSGHRGLRRGSAGGGIRHALLGRTWLAVEVQEFLRAGLRRRGLPERLWYPVAVIGLGEVAAQAGEDAFALDHLRLLADLPADPGGGATRS